jgi:tRNA threonylcarbamoyladenosine biosynthesis protein TsaB
MATPDLVLAVDGSQRDAALVVVVDSGGGLAESPALETAATSVVAAVRDALELYRHRLTAVLAVSGPGSYMGVRAGLAAALGAAHALALPLSLVGSLEVIAARADPGENAVLVLADAGRGGTLGQLLEPKVGPGMQLRWSPLGAAELLGRELTWPKRWSAPHWVIGSPGTGRSLPAHFVELALARDRRQALAWVVAGGPDPITGYDQVTAEYAQPVGA